MDIKQLSKSKAFGCDILKFSHTSPALGGLLTEWQAIVPSPGVGTSPLPVLYYYSGLTCTSDNVMQKGGAASACAEHRIIMIACDTSPRGAGAKDEDESWDFGTGAGFYVDATASDYKQNYRMFSFCQQELPVAVSEGLGDRVVDCTRAAVFGHSMGGLGALVAALRDPIMYRSVSAFSPICHPSACPWGLKCFTNYLGPDKAAWAEYDPTLLVRAGKKTPCKILIDQGTADPFLTAGQLRPDDLKSACEATGQALSLRMQEGYGHDYYFIQTFLGEHIAFHASHLYSELYSE